MPYVQSNGGMNKASGASLAVAYSSDNIAGHLLVAFLRYDDPAASSNTVTDSQGNSWTKIVTLDGTAADASLWEMWYAPNCKAGPNTVTMTPNVSTDFVLMLIAEYSRVGLQAPLDGHNQQMQNTAPNTADGITSGTFSTTRNGDLVISGLSLGTSTPPTLTHGTNFSERIRLDISPGTFERSILEDLTQAVAGSIAGTATVSAATVTATIAAAFKQYAYMRPPSMSGLGSGGPFYHHGLE